MTMTPGTGMANGVLAGVLVDEWARAGVAVAALAPGSRSTPMALALAGESRVRLEVFLDERSAAFFALGAAKASGRPAVVLCTSGTAAAELHPAVAEASAARVPLVVATADRPAELRDTGAPQTISQVGLYGGAVRWAVDVAAPEPADAASADRVRHWRSLASRAVGEALGVRPGPVHLNVAFREPLVADSPGSGPVVPGPVPRGRADGRPWTSSGPVRLAPTAGDVEAVVALAGAERGVIVAGWGAGVDAEVVARFAELTGWPVLADPLSGLRCGPFAVSTYEALLRASSFASAHRPDVALSLGAPPTSATVTAWLDDVERILVDPTGSWLDPRRTAARRVAAEPVLLLEAALDRLSGGGSGSTGGPSAWRTAWAEAEDAARTALDGLLDGSDGPYEGRTARDLVDCLPPGATLVVGSSMPVRDVEWFSRPRPGLRVLANRGANGIDGFVSTVLGVAAADAGPVAALTGDLALLHDAGGLLRASARGLQVTFVVADNDGGGIFSFLPQADGSERFERLFGTPHGLDLTALAAAYGVPAERVSSSAALVPAVEAAMAAGGVRLVIVPTDRVGNVAAHRRAWEVVAAAL